VKLFTLPGTMNKESYTYQIPSGQSGVMFFDVTYDDISPVPKAIAHRITVTTPPTPVGTAHTTIGHSIPIGREATVISPPFRGSGWVNSNGCCPKIAPHRFVINAMNGTLDPSETFAIDWVQVDAHCLAFRTDGKKPEDWIGYGAEVLAVAPGAVVEVVRDLSNVTPGKNPEGLTIAQIAGNRVIIDTGSGTTQCMRILRRAAFNCMWATTCDRGRSSACWGTRATPARRIFIFNVCCFV
jgi:hypothetical protein